MRVIRVIRVIRVLRRILNLLVAGNIVTVSYEQMREIRKELGRFDYPVI